MALTEENYVHRKLLAAEPDGWWRVDRLIDDAVSEENKGW